MGEWHGDDGQTYYSYDQWKGANNRYRQQQQHNKLLEDQNELIRQQNEAIKERERQEEYREMEQKAREREKEEEEIREQRANEKEQKRHEETEKLEDRIKTTMMLTSYKNEEIEQRKEREEKINKLRSEIELYNKVQKLTNLEEIEDLMIDIHNDIEYTEKLLKDKEMTPEILKKIALQEQKKLQQEINNLELIDYEGECNRIIEKFNLSVNEKTFEIYTYEEFYNMLPSLIEEELKRLNGETEQEIAKMEKEVNLLPLIVERRNLLIEGIRNLVNEKAVEINGQYVSDNINYQFDTENYSRKILKKRNIDKETFREEQEQIYFKGYRKIIKKINELFNQLNIPIRYINSYANIDLENMIDLLRKEIISINEEAEMSIDKNWSDNHIKKLLKFEGKYLIEEKVIVDTLNKTSEINEEYNDIEEIEINEDLEGDLFKEESTEDELRIDIEEPLREHKPKGKYDELLVEVVDYLTELDEVSCALVQKRFKVGVLRAIKILGQIEKLGLTSRKFGFYWNVLITREEWNKSNLRKEFLKPF